MPKNGLTWDKGATPQRVFRDAAEKYAGRLNDAVYRKMVTEAPGVQEVLQQVGTWDDNKAEGGDYIQARAYRFADEFEAGIAVYYDLETYRVLHPKEDPDFDWREKHLAGRSMSEIKFEYETQRQMYFDWLNAKQSVERGVDDRVVETFHDEARFIWDSLLSVLR